ncbi:MAG: hypothetical protein HYR64_08885 [Fimbriimonas ginsengisoli]|uniref:Uncharacterized protein n=1 Tax=Fimbriimonas ginsengisoli TaxID=1005039 RepID=A0A931LTI7_FIMGI|nr:hypothetical protein [Fimbriimonas ginsengisoli]
MAPGADTNIDQDACPFCKRPLRGDPARCPHCGASLGLAAPWWDVIEARGLRVWGLGLVGLGLLGVGVAAITTWSRSGSTSSYRDQATAWVSIGVGALLLLFVAAGLRRR